MTHTVAAYLAFWPVLALLGIANGIVRGLTYGRRMHDLRAHQLSTVTLATLTGIAVLAFSTFKPIPDARTAALIGIAWLAATVAFEFVFGRYVAQHSWSRLLADYDLRRGRVWPLFLGWLAMLPWLVYRL
jgi:hypothetical protein